MEVKKKSCTKTKQKGKIETEDILFYFHIKTLTKA